MSSTKSILLVEDNPDDVLLTKRALEKNQVANKVDLASDGEEALEILFDETRPLPQVVLLDLKLPKVDGLEVLRQVRQNERTKLLPIIILTSSSEERDMVEGYSLGANSYVRKPVNFEQFVEAVQTLGLYWLVLNETPDR